MKLVSESRVTWATSVPILVFLGLSVLNLGPMYATDRRQTKASLNAPPIRGGGIIIMIVIETVAGEMYTHTSNIKSVIHCLPDGEEGGQLCVKLCIIAASLIKRFCYVMIG